MLYFLNSKTKGASVYMFIFCCILFLGHVRGVAGGGWDDEDASAKLSGSSQGTSNKDEENFCSTAGDHSGTSFSADKLESDISKSDDCSSERQLINALVFSEDNNELIPKRDDIQKFVTR